MKTDYKLIDNFLPSDVFNEVQTLLLSSSPAEKLEQQINWYYTPNVVHNDKKDKDWKLVYFTHMVYDFLGYSPLYNKLIPDFYKRLKFKALRRIKCNMYPYTEILKEHGMHVDLPFKHKGAILSINTCNGYTKLEDGTKIDSIANRILLFDPSKPHSPSTTTDQPVRVNINFNYF